MKGYDILVRPSYFVLVFSIAITYMYIIYIYIYIYISHIYMYIYMYNYLYNTLYMFYYFIIIYQSHSESTKSFALFIRILFPLCCHRFPLITLRIKFSCNPKNLKMKENCLKCNEVFKPKMEECKSLLSKV